MEKLLLFGGTFDPPHNGHMALLSACLAAVQPNRALVLPAGVPPHKQASATPGTLRAEMCGCFRALSPCVEVSLWEMGQGAACEANAARRTYAQLSAQEKDAISHRARALALMERELPAFLADTSILGAVCGPACPRKQ